MGEGLGIGWWAQKATLPSHPKLVGPNWDSKETARPRLVGMHGLIRSIMALGMHLGGVC